MKTCIQRRRAACRFLSRCFVCNWHRKSRGLGCAVRWLHFQRINEWPFRCIVVPKVLQPVDCQCRNLNFATFHPQHLDVKYWEHKSFPKSFLLQRGGLQLDKSLCEKHAIRYTIWGYEIVRYLHPVESSPAIQLFPWHVPHSRASTINTNVTRQGVPNRLAIFLPQLVHNDEIVQF